MPAVHDGACRAHAISTSTFFVAIVAGSGAVTAQTVHPFGPPTAVAAFTLNAVVGIADVNRDGSSDLIAPGLFQGTLVTALDEDGNGLTTSGPGPGISRSLGFLTAPIAIAGGRIDQDWLEDVVTVMPSGTVHFHRNLGSQRLDRGHFAYDTQVDNFAASYPINPPFTIYSFPTARVLDFDLDGLPDVLLAGGPVDRWNASTLPGFVCLYRGNGQGGFQACRCPLPGSVIDVEVADLDNDGTHDHLVVLMETGSLGAFAYEIVHLAWSGGALVQTGTPQWLGNGRFTDLAMADVMGDGNLDYVLAKTTSSGGTTHGEVVCFQGDGLGHVSSTASATYWLPPNPTALGDYVPAIALGDWNRDGAVDLAVVRGFVQAVPTSSTVGASYANSELLVAMGPGVLNAPFETIALPGYHVFSWTDTVSFPLLPLMPAPGFLRQIDLRRDGSPDLLVTGLRSATGPMPTMFATLANATPPLLGDARFEKVGAPSGNAPSWPARIGFQGGRPCPGNTQFACNLLNVQGGSLVGLVWGPVGIANLCSAYGFDVHLAPAEYGYAAVASGSGPGEGFHSEPLPIPANPALVGAAGYFQYVYHDPVRNAFGGTQATGLWIGN